MSSLQYYLWHLVPLVLFIAVAFFLFGLAVGWLAWHGYQRDVAYWEEKGDHLRRELRSLSSEPT